MILLTFLWSVIILPTYCKYDLWTFRLPWKRVKNFRRRRLHYSLVQRCLRRSSQRPCRYGSFIPSTCCIKLHCWRRRNAKATARHKRHKTSTPEWIFTPIRTLICIFVWNKRCLVKYWNIYVMALKIFWVFQDWCPRSRTWTMPKMSSIYANVWLCWAIVLLKIERSMLLIKLIPRVWYSYGIQEHHLGWLHFEVTLLIMWRLI